MNSYKDSLLIEVIPAKMDVNQTVSTAVSVSKLKHQHRRSRRSVEKESNPGFDFDVVHISEDTGRFKVITLKCFDDHVHFDISINGGKWFFPSASQECHPGLERLRTLHSRR